MMLASLMYSAHIAVILSLLAHEMDAQSFVMNYREEVITECKKCIL
jgi:hypothetical protein